MSRRSSFLGLALCLLVLCQGCYGPFNAVRRIHNWNGTFENEWAQEGMFLVLIVPYGLWTLGDMLIFNSIQFWGGTNPVDPPSDG